MSSLGGNSRKRLIVTVVLLGFVLVLGLLAGYLPRRITTRELLQAASALKSTPPLVNATMVTRAPSQTEVSFPGNVTPITEAYIYARATGYLKRRYVDIGDRVTAGQVLAEIDAPDLDLQVKQGEASLSQAQGQLGQAQAMLEQLVATRDLAQVTWQRYQVLTKTGAISRQAGDNQLTAAKTSEANVIAGQKNLTAAEELVRATKAALDRLVTLQEYEKITSPFAGIVTARNVDVGALISVTGMSLGPVQTNQAGPSDVPRSGEIFRVAQIGRLRVLVPLPQTEASGIRVGEPATVTVDQLPNQVFRGHISRTSESLDAASRTLLTEVDTPNPTGALLPGMYATVHLITQRAVPPFLVPDASVVVGANGTSLAVLQPLGPEDREKLQSGGTDPGVITRCRLVHFKKVTVGRDYGTTVEIFDDLQDGEYVVVDPGDLVKEGVIVQMAPSDSEQKAKQPRVGVKSL